MPIRHQFRNAGWRSRLRKRIKPLRMETLETRRVLDAVPFAETTVFEGGINRSQAVGVGDFDGDGDLDIAALSASEVWVLKNDGSASFDTPDVYSSGSRGDSRGILVADVTGDGNDDLVVGSIAGDSDASLALLVNDGAGNFGEPVTLVDGMNATFVEAIDAGDTDGDGDVDIMMGDRGDDRRILHLVNQGDGTFESPVDLDFDSETEPKGLVLVDFDQDGDNDVVVTSSVEDPDTGEFPLNFVFWYKNNGSGVFARSLETETDADPRFLDVADFDGDGDQDIVFPAQEAGTVTVFVNDGSDTIDNPLALDAGLDSVERTKFSDLDGDGDLDVVVTIDGGGQVGWYENDAGAFTTLQSISDDTPQASGLAVGDMDGDGDTDVVTTSQFHGTVNLHLNNGDDTWATSELTGPNAIAPEATLLADFDGDGDLDVMALSSFDFELAWYENTDGEGTFDTRNQNLIADYDLSPRDLLWWDVELGDMDNDGDIDVVTTEPTLRDIVWYQNDGAGNFNNVFATGEPLGAVEVDVADVDGDGDLDMIATHFYGGFYADYNSVAWFENDGAGEFTARSVSTTADVAFGEVAYGDIDGDGDLDVVVGDNARNSYPSVIWYEQAEENGEIIFEENSIIQSERFGIEEVEVADMDGDGDLDVISASYGADYATALEWFANDGQGNFAADGTFIGDETFVSEIVVEDVDGDGDMDVVVPSRFTTSLIWWDNQGDGTFAAEPNVVNDQIITGDTGVSDRVLLVVDAGDINGDGRMDLVAPDSDSNRIVAFLQTDGVIDPGDPYDVNGDDVRDITDINLLCSELAAEGMAFDPNGDGVTNSEDLDAMIAEFGSVYGDVNLSGAFGTTDLVAVFAAGEYEDATDGNSLYSTGDWNCDGDFTTADLVFTFALGTYDPDAVGAVAATDTVASSDTEIAAAMDDLRADNHDTPDVEQATTGNRANGDSVNRPISRPAFADVAIDDFANRRLRRLADLAATNAVASETLDALDRLFAETEF